MTSECRSSGNEAKFNMLVARGRRHDGVLVDIVAGQLGGDLPAREHQHAVRQAEDFLDFEEITAPRGRALPPDNES